MSYRDRMRHMSRIMFTNHYYNKITHPTLDGFLLSDAFLRPLLSCRDGCSLPGLLNLVLREVGLFRQSIVSGTEVNCNYKILQLLIIAISVKLMRKCIFIYKMNQFFLNWSLQQFGESFSITKCFSESLSITKCSIFIINSTI